MKALQPEYNVFDRSGFDGLLRKLCMAGAIGVIAYFSLAKGFLSGKYRSEADLSQSPRGAGIKSYLIPRGLTDPSSLDAVSERHATKPAEVALAWLMARPGVTAPIASATTIPQLESLTRAASIKLTSEDVSMLDRASG
jgi:aryl-alcohol dehydrogenase-like predicted oxidoreductase